MHTRPRSLPAAAATVALLLTVAVPAVTAHADGPPVRAEKSPGQVVTDWAAIAAHTVYPATPVPAGTLYLGFASLAVYDAVQSATAPSTGGRASAEAAAATAAHDVLWEYFVPARAALDAALDASLAAIPDGRGQDRGIGLGHAAAAAMTSSRVGDHRGEAGHEFPASTTPGVWRPTPPLFPAMIVPWVGYVTPLVLDPAEFVVPTGPRALTSPEYAADLAETRTRGGLADTALTTVTRTPEQTHTARFFNDNAVLQYQDALTALLTRHPRGIVGTARAFAQVNASVADAMITTWREKREHGSWRPITAIQLADTDSNPITSPDPAWVPLMPTPPYPENCSGHAAITNAFVESLTLLWHTDHTDLDLTSAVPDSGGPRHYDSLAQLSEDAFNARIWLGYHFRTAMEEGLRVGTETARTVDSHLS
jgi:hypothetical protein